MIGWYVHHHGAGHRQRLAHVRRHLGHVVGLGSGPRATDEWVSLPGDETRVPADPTAAGTLHWAPVGHRGLTERMAAISGWIARERPDAMVVDVSVEVALLARLHGVPTVVVAQRGDRSDVPHRLAYTQAAVVVAPWEQRTHLPGTLPAEDRVRFTGAVSRFEGRRFAAVRPGGPVLLLTGAGGSSISADQVNAAARATPDRTWLVAGSIGGMIDAPNVWVQGPDADVGALLDRCSVVVGTAGSNVIAEVASARRPFVCLPQPRPFDEQEHQARALMNLGVAAVCPRWPSGERWESLLAEAEAMDTDRWSSWLAGDGARRMAEVIDGAVLRRSMAA